MTEIDLRENQTTFPERVRVLRAALRTSDLTAGQPVVYRQSARLVISDGTIFLLVSCA